MLYTQLIPALYSRNEPRNDRVLDDIACRQPTPTNRSVLSSFERQGQCQSVLEEAGFVAVVQFVDQKLRSGLNAGLKGCLS